MSGNYLRKCPHCNCFFFSYHNLKLHAKACHKIDVEDVTPYNPKLEASKRARVKYVYKYNPLKSGKCEICGDTRNIYSIGTEWGTTLTRCESCLLGMMETMRNVRFIEVKANEPIRGCERKIGPMDKY